MSSSSSTAGPPDDGDADIEAVLADYWQRLDREGRQFTAEIRQQMLAAHPSLASALQAFFAAEDAVAPADAASAESPPTVIRYVGDYEVLHLLGEGGMGAVYAARQQSTGRMVAVKLMRSVTGDAARRFRAEAKAIGRLRHPHIITLFEAGEDQGLHYYSMDLCSGGSLARRLQQQLPEPREAAEWALKLARALAYAHSRQVLHRDLKPANVLFDEHGEPILADFGLAKLVDATTHATRAGGIVGTFDYMPPEQASGASVTERSDIYALGATLYQMLTGRPPIPGATELQRLNRLATAEPAPITKLRPQTPRALAAICLHCLHKEPGSRYASAAELASDLELFLQGFAPRHPRRIGPLQRLGLWWRRNPVVAGLAFALAAVLLIGAAASSYFAWEARLQAAAKSREATRAIAATSAALRETDRANAATDEARHEAERARTAQAAADANAAANRRNLCRVLVGAGERLAEDRNLFQAIGMFAGPLVVNPDDPDEVLRARIRIANYFRHTSSLLLTNMLFPPAAAPNGPKLEKFADAAFDVEGDRIATVTRSGDLQLHDVNTGEVYWTTTATPFQVTAVQFSSDGSMVTSTCADGIVRVLATNDASVLRTFTNTGLHGPWMSPGGESVLIEELHTNNSKMLVLCDCRTGKRLTGVSESLQLPPIVEFNFDGKWVLVGSDTSIAVFDARTGEQAGPFIQFPRESALVAALSPDGLRWAIETSMGGIQQYDMRTGEPIGTEIRRHDRLVIDDVQYSTDGRRLLTRSPSGVHLWDAESCQPIGDTIRHLGAVEDAAFSPDGHWLLTWSSDGTAALWDARNLYQIGSFLVHSGSVRKARFSGDQSRVLTVGDADPVRIYSVTGLNDNRMRRSSRAFGESDSSQDEQDVPRRQLHPPKTLNWNGRRAWICDARTRESAGPLMEHAGHIELATTDCTCRRMLSWSGGDTVQLWDAEHGVVLHELAIPEQLSLESPVMSLDFSPTGATAAACTPTRVQLWDVETGKTIASLRWPNDAPHDSPLTIHRFSPDGRLFAAGRRRVHLWTTGDGLPLAEPLPGGTSLVVSPDSRLLAVARDDQVAIWDVDRNRQVGLPLQTRFGAAGVEFSPDGSQLLIATTDGAVELWDVSTQTMQFSVQHHEAVTALAFAPDGRSFLTAGDSVRWWHVDDVQPLSPPLKTGRLVRDVEFAADSAELYVYDLTRNLSHWSIRASHAPADDLIAFSQLISARTIDASGRIAALNLQTCRQLWERVSARFVRSFTPDAADEIEWRQWEVAVCGESQEWSAVAFHLRHLQNDNPSPDKEVLLQRVASHMSRTDWSSARVDLERVIASVPDNLDAWVLCATVALVQGATADYPYVCRKILHRFGDTSDPETASRVLYAIVQWSDPSADARRHIERLAPIAEQAWTGNERIHGAALYRCGQHEAARQRFEVSMAKFGLRAWDHFFIAMIEHALGHDEAAATALADGQALMLEAKTWSMSERIEVQALATEAAEIISRASSSH